LEVNSSGFLLRALPLLGGVNPQDVKELKILCALFSKQHPSAHRFYRSYGYSLLIVYSRSMELRIETFGKLFSASEGFIYDDRPLFLSFFYSDTLFGLVMQIVKELKLLSASADI